MPFSGAMSLMSMKSFAAGELGIFVTDNREMYERAMAFGHYDRNNDRFITESEELFPYYHMALGGVKGRYVKIYGMGNNSSASGPWNSISELAITGR